MRRAALPLLFVLILVGMAVGGLAVGTVGSFEVDGNRPDDSGPGEPIDWGTPPPGFVDFTDLVKSNADDSFVQGSKELEPGAWKCGTGGIPGKDDIAKGAVAFRFVGADQFLYVNWERAEVNGSAHIDYEFSQAGPPATAACPDVPARTDGDILVKFDFNQGGAQSSIEVFTWQFTGSGVGIFVPLPAGSEHTTWDAAVNGIAGGLPEGTLPAGAFGEASLNVSQILGHAIECGEFSGVYMKTRSSFEINSAMKDRTGVEPVPLTCALSLDKQANVASVGPDGQIVYTITATNSGQGAISQATITEEIPSGTTFASCTGGCTQDGTTVTWSVGPILPGGSAIVTLTVDVTGLPDGCLICNTATVSSPDVNDGNPVTSNQVCVTFVPPPADVSAAVASGSALGAGVSDDLLGLNEEFAPSSSSQTGVGTDSDSDPGIPVDAAPVLGAALLTSSSTSEVSASQATQTSRAEVANVNVLGGAVKADKVLAVATTNATPSSSGFDSTESTIKGLVVSGVAVNDVTPGKRVDLPAAIFGAESYVALYERIGSTTPPPGLSGGTFAADLTVNMIRVHVTGALGVEAVEIVVAQAIAHSEFPQSTLCVAPPAQAVSGHAFITKVATDPSLAPITVGRVDIPATGGHEHQDLDEAATAGSEVTAGAAVSDSSGSLGAGLSTAQSFAEATGICLVPSAGVCTVSAQFVRAQANSAADDDGASSTDDGTILLGLEVMGDDVCEQLGEEPGCTPAPNTRIEIPGVATLVLNEQFCDGSPIPTTPGPVEPCTGANASGLTVRAIHLIVLDPAEGGVPGAEIIVAEAHADASFTAA